MLIQRRKSSAYISKKMLIQRRISSAHIFKKLFMERRTSSANIFKQLLIQRRKSSAYISKKLFTVMVSIPQPLLQGTHTRSEETFHLHIIISLDPVRVYCRRQLRSAPGRAAPEGVLGFELHFTLFFHFFFFISLLFFSLHFHFTFLHFLFFSFHFHFTFSVFWVVLQVSLP